MINIVHNSDCLPAMREMKDNQFDLAIVDVEYGIKQGGDKNHTRGKLAISKNYHSFNDDNSPKKEYFNELLRISKNQIIWGANHFISKIPHDSSCWVVWDKVNGKTDFADCELAWTSFKSAVRQFRFQWQGMLQQDMKNKEIRIHPTQKPVALYKWLLKNYAKEGNIILDTHVGSMSSVIASIEMGFSITAYEIDKDYFNAGKKRVLDYFNQENMFRNNVDIQFIDTQDS